MHPGARRRARNRQERRDHEIAWTPLNISGCQLWLRSTSITADDSTAVGTWSDESGNSNDLTAAGDLRPTYLSSTDTLGPNLLPLVRFDGSDDALTSTASGLVGVQDGDDLPCTVFFAGKNFGSAATICYASWCRGDQNNVNKALKVATSYRFDVFDGVETIIASGGTSNDNPKVLTFLATGTTASIWDDGANVLNAGTWDAVDVSVITRFGLGASVRLTHAQHCDSDFGEVIIYNTALSTVDRQRVERYLGSKWGIVVA